METDMADRDVTELVRCGSIDDETMPIEKCICGTEYSPWRFFISIYRNAAYECPACNRKLYFRQTVSVFEVVESPLENESLS